MQMVAASKMRRAQEAVTATRAYAETGLSLMTRLREALSTQGQDGYQHPLLATPSSLRRIVLVVIASDKGLAGGYNSNVTKRTVQFLDAHKDNEVTIITVGRKAEEALSRMGYGLAASFTDFPSRPTAQDLQPIAELSIEAFLAGRCDQVVVIYTKFYSTLRQITETQQILPVTIEADDSEPLPHQPHQPLTAALFEPSPNQVLDFVVPRMVGMQLLQAVLDALASEHSSRMMAMKNATDNATELIGDLRLTYNSARQAAITQEIAEISAGAGS
jgi:F-type H+-transporting ATPase subunit gamma